MSGRSTPPVWIQKAMPKRCCMCGSTKGIQYDHINPAAFLANKREWTIENTRPLCTRCHYLISHGQLIAGQGEILRDHGFLVRDGVAKAKARGVRFGKPPADYEKIMRLIAENSTQFNDTNDVGYTPKTEHEIMEMAGVKPVCYAKCKRMLLDAMNGGEWSYSWPMPVQVRNHPLYDHCVKRLRGDT